MPRATPKGYFITFEGGEGSGKTTQIRLLAEWLQSKGLSVVTTREPGGTPLGQKIRDLLLSESSPDIAEQAELLLYEADRAQHVFSKIRPALLKGSIVLCDRFADSSTVYQGHCRGLGIAVVEKLNAYATGGLKPDLVFVLDLPAERGLRRVALRSGGRMDRMEKQSLEFHEKVRRGFLKLARRNPSRYVVLKADDSLEALAALIQKKVEDKLKRRSLWNKH